MSKRIPMVDFGPVGLPVNGAHELWETLPGASSARDSDAIRLKRLLQGSGDEEANGAGSEAAHGAGWLVRPEYPGPAATRTADAIHCMKLAAAVASITTGYAVRIELHLNPELLPGAWLSVEKTQEDIQFELRVSNASEIDRLSIDLDKMACDIGNHLDAAVTLRIFNSQGMSAVKVAAWRPGGQA